MPRRANPSYHPAEAFPRSPHCEADFLGVAATILSGVLKRGRRGAAILEIAKSNQHE
ncbi:hypothetical protein SBA5_1060009 [Candidatus Sulfotelmatomonas gaucii]|uniref:Uncharacterized protein n=1 Tax=Candidatus Sulfuritelmatomonas gaucii TaxID=2043161 RepID=A0A2N9L2N7_9BACT|nr:hypothetical protein SBA5_1060009 [Candidatus Sulfotelmatomonas gaucii]